MFFLITGVKAPPAKEEKIFEKQTEQGKRSKLGGLLLIQLTKIYWS